MGPPLDDHSPATYLYWSGPSAAAASTTPSATSRPVSLEPSLDARSCSSPTWASRRTSGLHTRSMRPSLGCGQNAASFTSTLCDLPKSVGPRHGTILPCPQHQRNVFHSAVENGTENSPPSVPGKQSAPSQVLRSMQKCIQPAQTCLQSPPIACETPSRLEL